jgi:hypothetical protein
MFRMSRRDLIRSLGSRIYPHDLRCHWEWIGLVMADLAREEGTIMSALGESEIVITAD